MQASAKKQRRLTVVLIVILFAAIATLLLINTSAGPQDPNDPNYPLADTNGDLTVNIFDLSYTLNQWNSNDPTADFNSDGSVNILDLSYLLAQWGRVDEPGGGGPTIGACWGNPVGHSGYSPTEIIDQPGQSPFFVAEAQSARFVAPTTANLIGVRTYIIHVVASGGFYGSGDGGTIEYSIETDDNTSLHGPSGTVIGRTGNIVGAPGLSGSKYLNIAIANPYGEAYTDRSNFLRYDFLDPVPVQEGEVYHLITRNTSPDPTVNAIAHNHNQQWRPNLPQNSTPYRPDIDRDQHLWDTCPGHSPLDSGVLYKHAHSTDWQVKLGQNAIAEYYFDDGTVWGSGVGTIQSNSTNGNYIHYVNGTSRVRQTITPSVQRLVCSVGVRVAKNEGSSSGRLTAKIIAAGSGQTVWQHDFATDAFPVSADSSQPTVANMTADWAEAALSTPLTLNAGQIYYLELSTTPGTTFRVGAFVSFTPFDDRTYFSEGVAEFSPNGSTWQSYAGSGSNIADISFLFRESGGQSQCS